MTLPLLACIYCDEEVNVDRDDVGWTYNQPEVKEAIGSGVNGGDDIKRVYGAENRRWFHMDCYHDWNLTFYSRTDKPIPEELEEFKKDSKFLQQIESGSLTRIKDDVVAAKLEERKQTIDVPTAQSPTAVYDSFTEPAKVEMPKPSSKSVISNDKDDDAIDFTVRFVKCAICGMNIGNGRKARRKHIDEKHRI